MLNVRKNLCSVMVFVLVTKVDIVSLSAMIIPIVIAEKSASMEAADLYVQLEINALKDKYVYMEFVYPGVIIIEIVEMI